jgi:putative membrane-bound dehydrogenase-like protein
MAANDRDTYYEMARDHTTRNRTTIFSTLCGCALWLSAVVAVAEENPRAVTSRLQPDDQISHFVLPEGFKIELVAAEPTVINPVCMALDERGRLYVSQSHTYRFPEKTPVQPPTNPIVRLDPAPDDRGFRGVLVAQGFEDPVLGMAIRDGKLWCTSNNYLYRYDLSETGAATNRQTILVDRNRPRNPHGMFRIKWGPDGLLYMTVGDHDIDIAGPTNTISGRGPSGVALRMQPDGSDLELLAQGLRMPCSFELGAFGRLWVLSNGEGNPNRFIRVIEGVDYHCFTRNVDYTWLAGTHPLSPPCQELPRGAWADLLRYDGAQFPRSYDGNLFVCNWGAHGFPSPNHMIYRVVPKEDGTGVDVTADKKWLTSTDPHFRPSTLLLAPDGAMLIADWYGVDDESDLTGRVWKVTYSGDDNPQVTRQGDDPRNAANALWKLFRRGDTDSIRAIANSTKHRDWRVRRLAVDLLRRRHHPEAATVAATLQNDTSLAVGLEAAKTLEESRAARAALWNVLKDGAADDPYLCYEAAWHLAKHAEAKTWSQLLASAEGNLRLAVWIGIDIAIFEELPSRAGALTALADSLALADPRDIDIVLDMARANPEKELVPALLALVSRKDVPATTVGEAVLVLSVISTEATTSANSTAIATFLAAVKSGALEIKTADDAETLYAILGSQEPSPFAVEEVRKRLFIPDGRFRRPAHRLARKFGPSAAALGDELWAQIEHPHFRRDAGRSIELIATLLEIERSPDLARWQSLLMESSLLVTTEVLRSWRRFANDLEAWNFLSRSDDALISKYPTLAADYDHVLLDSTVRRHRLSNPPSIAHVTDKKILRDEARKIEPTTRRAVLGRRVFERAGCAKCHVDISTNTTLAPLLTGIGKDQSVDYLIDSILEPSKVIKTGFDTEVVITTDGRALTGLVREEPGHLRILTVDSDTVIARADVEQRVVQSKSIMPDGIEKTMSQDELNDLLVYLRLLK